MPNIKQSATDFIKKHNPQNKSGTVPQALELIQNLREIPKLNLNPKMIDAVGPKPLMQLLQFIQQNFFKEIIDKLKEKKKKGEVLSEQQEQDKKDIENDQKLIEELEKK